MRLQTAHERLLNFLSHYIRRAKSVHLWPYRIFHLQVLEKHLAKFTPDTIFCATEDHYICSQFGCVAFYRTFECGPLNLRLYRQSGIAVVEVAFVYTLLVRCGKYLVVLYHVTVFFVFRKKKKVLLYSFFWMIPRRLNFMCQRFGTLCSIFIGGVSRKNNRDEIVVFIREKLVLLNVINLFLFNLSCAGFHLFSCLPRKKKSA